MTDQFCVDLDHLTALSRRLDASRVRVEAAAAALDGDGAALGVAALDDACRELRHRRRAGLGLVADDVGRVRDRLADTAAAYAAADAGPS